MRTGYMSSRQSDFSAFRTQLAPMRAARARLAGAKNLHSLESLAAGWLPIELLRELASLPLKRMRWLPLPLVFWACLNMVLHPGSSCRETQRSIQGLVEAPQSPLAQPMQQRLLRGPRAPAFGLAARALVARRRPARRLGPGSARLPRASRARGRWHLGHRPRHP